MPSNRFALRAATTLVASVAFTFGTFAVVAPSATAAPAAPTGLTPTGPVPTATPTLSWSSVSGAVAYEVQADNSSDFGSPELNLSTVNTKAVPTAFLPDGTIDWRVRVVDKNGQKSAWSREEFEVSSVAPPTPIAPADAAQLFQPNDPPLLSWDAVPGATAYDVEIDRDGNWIGQTSATTQGTSYLVSNPQEIGLWSWRVRAQRGKGLVTAWSDPMTYEIMPLEAVQADPNMNTGESFTDVAIDWDPVPGAVKYQLQIDEEPDFNDPVDDIVVVSTRYSPPATYLNSDWYWRVRAIDGSNNRMDWPLTPFQFNRSWPNAPELLYPPNNTSVGDPFYYQWTPVQWATHYRLEVGTDAGFTPGTYKTCQIAATTYTPRNSGDCGAPISDARYWRVKAVDLPGNVQGIYSPIWQIDYNPGNVQLLEPAQGASVQVPTFKWAAFRDTERYLLSYWKTATPNSVTDVTTYALSYTPAALLEAGSYGWRVQAYDNNGDLSNVVAGRTFTVSDQDAPTLGTPEPTLPNTTKSSRFPNLTWTPVVGASYYEIFIKRDFQSAYEYTGTYLTNTKFKYPAATDVQDAHLSTGVWDWFVTAYDAAGVPISSGSDGHFEITDLPSADGWMIAMDGNANRLGQGCDKHILIDVTEQCEGVPATPVLKWDPVPGASYYWVYLANDRELTNLLYGAPDDDAMTQNTMWVPPAQLKDNTAGTSYYWIIRPCKTENRCNPDPASVHASATNAFRKLSPGVVLQTPEDETALDPSVQSDDVQFDWEDYYETNQGEFYFTGDEPSYQTAYRYHVQISQSPVFATLVVNTFVDQTTFTSYGSTLPEGKLYWRVQAMDGSNNGLQWSDTWEFTKRSGETTLTSPVGGVTVSGDTPFRWAPKNFAGSYRIEIYKNDDPVFSPVNRVLTAVTKQPSYAPLKFLAPSNTAYRWRVQAIDASGRDTAWSTGGRFFVSTGTLTTLAPTSTGYLNPRTLYFAWEPVQRAANYRLEVRNSVTNGGALNVVTAANAYAPLKALGDASYEWRVTALDPNGGSLGQSPWKPFLVDQTGPVLTNPKPKAFNGGTKVSLSGTFSESVKGVSTKTVKLYRKGRSTAIKSEVTLTKGGTKLLIVNKGRLALRVGQVYVVKLTSGIRDMADNRLTKTVITINVVARRQVVARWGG